MKNCSNVQSILGGWHVIRMQFSSRVLLLLLLRMVARLVPHHSDINTFDISLPLSPFLVLSSVPTFAAWLACVSTGFS
jgi:hypothetical protein